MTPVLYGRASHNVPYATGFVAIFYPTHNNKSSNGHQLVFYGESTGTRGKARPDAMVSLAAHAFSETRIRKKGHNIFQQQHTIYGILRRFPSL